MDRGNRIQSIIDHIIPSQNAPYQIARIKLSNDERTLSPGLVIQAEVIIAEANVALVVSNDAVQIMEGKEGVFVKQGQEYVFTPLELGLRDKHSTEVHHGINQGDEYVSVNSYLLKADIKKSEAEHSHSH